MNLVFPVTRRDDRRSSCTGFLYRAMTKNMVMN